MADATDRGEHGQAAGPGLELTTPYGALSSSGAPEGDAAPTAEHAATPDDAIATPAADTGDETTALDATESAELRDEPAAAEPAAPEVAEAEVAPAEESDVPADETMEPADAREPDVEAPDDTADPADDSAPADEAELADEAEPADTAEPADEAEPADDSEPAVEAEPAVEESEPADEGDVPPDEAGAPEVVEESGPADEVDEAESAAEADEPAAEAQTVDEVDAPAAEAQPAEPTDDAEPADQVDEPETAASADEAEAAAAADDATPADHVDDAEAAAESADPAAEAEPAAEGAGPEPADEPASEPALAADDADRSATAVDETEDDLEPEPELALPALVEVAAAPARVSRLGTTPPPANPQPAPAVPAPAYTALPVNRADDPASSWTAPPPSEPTVRFDRVPGPESSDRPSSPLDGFEAEDDRRRWPRTLAIVAGVLVVLGGAYVGAAYGLGDKVPRGTTVAGVDIGGLSSSAAIARLHDQLADGSGQPIPVVVGQKSAELKPADAGLEFDANATVDRLTGVDLAQPVRLWHQVVGLGEQAPTESVDRTKLKAAVSDLADETADPAVDGAITFVDGTAHTTTAVDGTSLDEGPASDLLARTWLSAPRPITLPTRTVAPAISKEETDRAMREIVQPLTLSPVSVQVQGQIAVLQPAQLTAAASITPKDGKLVLAMDGKALASDVAAQVPGAITSATDASFQFQNDQPVIVPGQPGTQIDADKLAASVAGAAVTTNRTVDASLVPTDPAQSTAALEALGIKEIVSEFATPLTSDHIRDINIAQGAKNITGVLVRPGETFSLVQSIGTIDAAHGFVPAGAIVDGEHTDAMGGGLSQLSTTTYNAAFFAGFKDIAHTPHSEWFTRYPEGRESTVFAPTIDMKWQNTSPYGALVQAWVAGGQTHVRIWGTKYWTVDSTTSARSNVVQPTTVYDQSAGCEASAAGNPGFTVTVTRTLSLNGVQQSTDKRTTRYKPQNKTVCGPKPTATTPPAP